jgi:hypothetical protein
MRGYKINQLSNFIPSPRPSPGAPKKTGHKGEGVNGTAEFYTTYSTGLNLDGASQWLICRCSRPRGAHT